MKKKRLILFLATIAIMLIMGVPRLLDYQMVSKNNRDLGREVKSTNNSIVTLNEVVPFQWDAVYSFTPYTSKEDIEAIIGFEDNNIKETVNEGMVQLLFVKDERVVCSICGYSSSLGYDIELPKIERGYLKINYSDNAYFAVIKQQGAVKLSYIE